MVRAVVSGGQIFSDVVKPLADNLRKSVPFPWSPQCQVAFDSLKNLCSAPILATLDFSKPFKLEVVASDTWCRCCTVTR